MKIVKAWEEKVTIPTYEVGESNKNPMFLEERVYQGTSGVVYPYPVIDKVSNEKTDKEYNALFLENEYLKIMILPELGGRIQMAYDKTNDYHFFYYNRVIKPAMVGLTGPWISGGLEFNWPQHHRPSTFEPVDYSIEENEDGSKTVWVNETEIMFHTKGMAGFTLYPDKAYIKISGQLYNRTPFPQTFLWWANPAVHVDEHYQSVFPPDVSAVYDHGKRDVSSFPIATGTYYKVDYSPGTDISRYLNIPVPTSYMAVDSKFDFVGGYHHQKQAGMLHVADHHISPGKKQWTWGSGDFGITWDKQLTDEDGPYYEIMTGVYTDNQPDFSWIMPNEERTFTQYFLPYKEIGYVKNATRDAAVNLELINNKIRVSVYVTSTQENIHIILKNKDAVLFEEKATLSPTVTFTKELDIEKEVDETNLLIEVFDKHGKPLVSYKPVNRIKDAIPQPAKAIDNDPKKIKTIEELYMAALHLEQFRHATYSPVIYYEEALTRDPSDTRCNNALGLWYLKHGQFEKAVPYFHKAIERLTRHNPNPYNGEPYYNLGLCLTFLQRWDEAYNAFYKACWNAAWQDNAYLQLAYIDCRRGNFEKAFENVEHSLARNYHGMKARHLKAIILQKLNKDKEAEEWIKATLAMDRFDFGSRNELINILSSKKENKPAEEERKELKSLTRSWEQSYIEIAIDYARGGFYEEAVLWLLQIKESACPMVHYYLTNYYANTGNAVKRNEALQNGFNLPPDKVFPNRLEDILVLQFVIKENPQDFKAAYYLGNLWYDKRQYKEARQCWEESVAVNNDFPTTHRNLGIAYYNNFDDPVKALQEYEKSFGLDTSDSRILFEFDLLKKKENKSIEERLAFLEKHYPKVEERDDLYIEYVTLHNLSGNYDSALQLLGKRYFHPWEGGEGKVSGQYVFTKIALAKQSLQDQKYDQAIQLLMDAQHYPENLGEGKLYVAQENNIFYWLGSAYQAKGDNQKAEDSWQLAAKGSGEPEQALYYNDQDPAMIFYQGLALQKLGEQEKGKKRFENLINYGQSHVNDNITIDFFAVSLPELSVFVIDMDKRNRIHCNYLMGLGHLGLDAQKKAAACFEKVLTLDPAHTGAIEHLHFDNWNASTLIN